MPRTPTQPYLRLQSIVIDNFFITLKLLIQIYVHCSVNLQNTLTFIFATVFNDLFKLERNGKICVCILIM